MGRRENGMGTIYQKKPGGTWTGRIYIGKDTDGKIKYRYVHGETQAEVKRKLRAVGTELMSPDGNMTVERYLKRWLEIYKLDTVKRSTYDRIETVVRVQIVPYLGNVKVCKLTSQDIQLMLRELMNEGLAYNTIKKAHDTLNNALTTAVKLGDIPRNPMGLVKMPSSSLFPKKEIRYFTEREANLIAEESRREYSTGAPVYIYGDVFLLMLNTGLRSGEALGLEKRDWDPEKRVLYVRRNQQSIKRRDADGTKTRGYELVLTTPKSYSGTRIIPLNQTATEAVARLCAAHPRSERIVCSAKGTPLPPERMERTFYRLLDNVGLERTGVHALRHTFASFLFAKGIDIKTISKLLGHASTQITLNTYVHLLNRPEYTAVGVLDDIF